MSKYQYINGFRVSKKTINLNGRKFGRWTVVRLKETKNNILHWLCECECGKTASVAGCSLRNGLSKSCGCLNKEKTSKRNYTHGKSKTWEYSIWQAVLNRCYNERDPNYFRYGGRGIVVCQGLQDSFEWFLEIMGNRPGEVIKGKRSQYSIDRINNEQSYNCGACSFCLEKGFTRNVRWTTEKQQQRNKRSNHLLTYKGETKTLVEWTEELNLSYHLVKSRINNLGWSVEEAFETESKGRTKRYYYKGKSLFIREWAKELGIKESAISSRIHKLGWSFEKAVSVEVEDKTQKPFTYQGVVMFLPEWARHMNIPYNALRSRIYLGWDFERAITTPVRSSKKK